jgi:protein SCO1/2
MAAPAFSLTDQTGAKLGVQDEHGHWAVVTFMYTHCLDVCPLIANSLRAASAQLPDLRSLAISVDPKGDTPASVKKFLKAHRLPATFHYLTGTRAELAPVWKKYNVAATGGPRSTVSHSSFEILVDPKGRERIYFDAQIKAVDVIHDVKLLEQQG